VAATTAKRTRTETRAAERARAYDASGVHPDICDVCGAGSTVDDSRPDAGCRRRRRQCANYPKCRRRWTTWESRTDPRIHNP
jgi:hypothetical protein